MFTSLCSMFVHVQLTENLYMFAHLHLSQIQTLVFSICFSGLLSAESEREERSLVNTFPFNAR